MAGDLLNMRDLETEREYYDYYYGSYLRDQAVILYTLTILNNQEEALPLLKTICENLNKDTWYSTQSLAWSLFSYMKFAESLPAENDTSSKVSLSFNGEKSELSVISNQIVKKELKMKEGTNLLELENRSGKPVYANLVRKGVPLVSDNSVSEKGLSMKVDYLDMDLKPVNKNSLEQGSDFMMVVRITNKTFTSVGNIALTQMVPSGWEIRNTRLFEAGFGIRESSYDYRDIRDDRVNTYFGLSNGETKTFLLILNAAYKGEFFQPSVWCEAMYTENCYSGIPGGVVKVTGQNFE